MGKVYSLSGKHPVYAPYNDLPRGGPPFHPRCSKSIIAFNERLATPEQRAKSLPDETSRQLLNKTPGEAQRIFQQSPQPVPASTAASVPPQIAEAARAWASSLTPHQVSRVTAYQSKREKNPGYRDINSYFRFGTKPKRGVEWVEQTAAALEEAIAKGALPVEVNTYRAIRGNKALIADWQEAMETGIPWTERGFSSTSLSTTTSPEFCGRSKRKVLFAVTLPSGTKVAYPTAASGQLDEQLELILGRGSRFEIISIDRQPDGVTLVKARLL